MNVKRLLALAVLAVLAAPAAANAAITTLDAHGQLNVNGVAQFPIGLSGAPAGAIPETAAGGATFYQYQIAADSLWSDPGALADAQAYDAAAAASGTWTWVNLRGDNPLTPWIDIEGTELAGVALTVGTDPGMGVWRGDGEPLWHHTRPGRIASKAMDDHVWATIQAAKGTKAQMAAYSPYTDISGVDVLPVEYGHAHPNLATVGVWTERATAAMPTKSIWTTIQVCAAAGQRVLSSGGAYVVPNYKQTRFMVWDAILNGARGINFFGSANGYCETPADRASGFNQRWWNATGKPVIAELHALAPALADQRYSIPARTGYQAMIFKGGGKTYTVRINLTTFAVRVVA
jgi:hypothetical protein